MESKTKIFIYEFDMPTRLDRFLSDRLPTVSRSQIQRLIKNGMIKIEQLVVTKTGYLLDKKGTAVEIYLPVPTPLDINPENVDLDILFEDNDVLVINKPAGMVMHPSAGHSERTLVHAALGHTSFEDGIGGKMRPGIVHRLDKNTSGVVIVAKNEKAHVWLQKQFKFRKAKKIYVALVDKHPPTEIGKIVAPIYRDRTNRKKMAVAPTGKGKEAETVYHTIKKFNRFSFLEIQPLTGRTHQIRVHLSSIGSPITGDTIYGYATPTLALNRQFLHARTLEICLPEKSKRSVFEADLPDELQNIINNLE